MAAIASGISGLALAVSVLAYLLSRRSAIAARLPVLVFRFDPSGTWELRNVGKGCALNIRVSLRGRRSGWTESVTIPSLADGEVWILKWVGAANVWMLGAEYEDATGLKYTSVSQHDMNLRRRGWRLARFAKHDVDYLGGRRAWRYWDVPNVDEDRSLM